MCALFHENAMKNRIVLNYACYKICGTMRAKIRQLGNSIKIDNLIENDIDHHIKHRYSLIEIQTGSEVIRKNKSKIQCFSLIQNVQCAILRFMLFSIRFS